MSSTVSPTPATETGHVDIQRYSAISVAAICLVGCFYWGLKKYRKESKSKKGSRFTSDDSYEFLHMLDVESVTESLLENNATDNDNEDEFVENRLFLSDLAQILDSRLHCFIYLLKDPSGTFNGRSEINRLKLESSNGFYECGREALLQWSRQNHGIDQIVHIKEALEFMDLPLVLEQAKLKFSSRLNTPVTINSNANCSNTCVLHRLFYVLSRLMDTDTMTHFFLQLPKSGGGNLSNMSNIVDRTSRTHPFDVDTSNIEALIEWRTLNRNVDLEKIFQQVLTELDQKIVLDNEEYRSLICQLK